MSRCTELYNLTVVGPYWETWALVKNFCTKALK